MGSRGINSLDLLHIKAWGPRQQKTTATLTQEPIQWKRFKYLRRNKNVNVKEVARGGSNLPVRGRPGENEECKRYSKSKPRARRPPDPANQQAECHIGHSTDRKHAQRRPIACEGNKK